MMTCEGCKFLKVEHKYQAHFDGVSEYYQSRALEMTCLYDAHPCKSIELTRNGFWLSYAGYCDKFSAGKPVVLRTGSMIYKDWDDADE